jgi:MFS family permease
MLATLPGRTQGLGLITEPLLAEWNISRPAYAQINLWATLLGATICLPVGSWLDRIGLRRGAFVLLPSLAIIVGLMSMLPTAGILGLFGFILLTRAFGQSALSVLSLAVAGRAFKSGTGAAAGVYAILLSVLFAISFVLVGEVVRDSGWRTAWGYIAVALLCMVPVAWGLNNRSTTQETETGTDRDLSLKQAVRIPAFWVYALSIAAFAAITSGVSLFNEAVLLERGFDQKTFHTFLASFIIALLGQMICGWGTRYIPLRFWLGGALLLQATALAGYSFIHSGTQVWYLATVAGNSSGILTLQAALLAGYALPQANVGLWILAAVSGIAGGIITVAFFAIWGESFGKRHLGKIQGCAQTFSVIASALGPVLLEGGYALLHGYAKTLMVAAPGCVILGLLTLFLKPRSHA